MTYSMKRQSDVAIAIHSVETRTLQEYLSNLPKKNALHTLQERKYPKISIIMPSYNQARYLERSILSVLNQGYPSLEFIIIDGGSTDGTIEIIKKYESYLAYWSSGSDRGQSDALNHGFSKATGDILGWLNSDDLYLPDAFHYVVEAFRIQPKASVFFGDWWEIDSDDKVTWVYHAFDFSLGHFIYEGFHLNSQSMFWLSGVHERFNKFDIKLHRTMDYDLILRFGLVEGQDAFFRIPHPLACFRRHDEQKTQGFDSVVQKEHRQIALKNGISNKYSFFGKVARIIYRFRRAYWYVKRGGFTSLVNQSRGWRTRVMDMMSCRIK